MFKNHACPLSSPLLLFASICNLMTLFRAIMSTYGENILIQLDPPFQVTPVVSAYSLGHAASALCPVRLRDPRGGDRS